jgi:hypothetical protein
MGERGKIGKKLKNFCARSVFWNIKGKTDGKNSREQENTGLYYLSIIVLFF